MGFERAPPTNAAIGFGKRKRRGHSSFISLMADQVYSYNFAKYAQFLDAGGDGIFTITLGSTETAGLPLFSRYVYFVAFLVRRQLCSALLPADVLAELVCSAGVCPRCS